jgi:hypothetical protein
LIKELKPVSKVNDELTGWRRNLACSTTLKSEYFNIAMYRRTPRIVISIVTIYKAKRIKIIILSSPRSNSTYKILVTEPYKLISSHLNLKVIPEEIQCKVVQRDVRPKLRAELTQTFNYTIIYETQETIKKQLAKWQHMLQPISVYLNIHLF